MTSFSTDARAPEPSDRLPVKPLGARRLPGPTRWRHRYRRRGTTFIEAILVLSVLVIAFAGSLHFGKLTMLLFQAQAEARDCAWRIALSSCAEEPPEDCQENGYAPGQSEPRFDNISAAGEAAPGDVDPNEDFGGEVQAEGPAPNTDGPAAADRVNEAQKTEISGMLLKRVTSRAGRETKQPPLLGGESVQVHGKFNLPCNTKPQGVGDLAVQIFKDLTGL